MMWVLYGAGEAMAAYSGASAAKACVMAAKFYEAVSGSAAACVLTVAI